MQRGDKQKSILMQLDETDLKILRELQANARLTTKELAARVNLSTTPVFERVRRLEREGFINRYIAIVNAEKLNRGFTVFCSIKMQRLSPEIVESFRAMMQNISDVTECYNISGAYDFLLKILAPDMKRYQSFLLDMLSRMPHIASVESIFVMDELKHDYGVRV